MIKKGLFFFSLFLFLMSPVLAQENYLNFSMPTAKTDEPEESQTLSVQSPKNTENYSAVTSVAKCIDLFSEREKQEILNSAQPYGECLNRRMKNTNQRLSAGEIQERIKDKQAESVPDHFFQVAPLTKNWKDIDLEEEDTVQTPPRQKKKSRAVYIYND